MAGKLKGAQSRMMLEKASSNSAFSKISQVKVLVVATSTDKTGSRGKGNATT
jgi:hypothetical protein